MPSKQPSLTPPHSSLVSVGSQARQVLPSRWPAIQLPSQQPPLEDNVPGARIGLVWSQTHLFTLITFEDAGGKKVLVILIGQPETPDPVRVNLTESAWPESGKWGQKVGRGYRK